MTTPLEPANEEYCPSPQRRAAFESDLDQVVHTIAQRYRSNGAGLTWQLVRDIREEALADLGLAARWPGEMIERVASASPIPPLDGWIGPAEIGGLCDLARTIADVFRAAATTASPNVVV